jgi:hypothetical protein
VLKAKISPLNLKPRAQRRSRSPSARTQRRDIGISPSRLSRLVAQDGNNHFPAPRTHDRQAPHARLSPQTPRVPSVMVQRLVRPNRPARVRAQGQSAGAPSRPLQASGRAHITGHITKAARHRRAAGASSRHPIQHATHAAPPCATHKSLHPAPPTTTQSHHGARAISPSHRHITSISPYHRPYHQGTKAPAGERGGCTLSGTYSSLKAPATSPTRPRPCARDTRAYTPTLHPNLHTERKNHPWHK